MVRLDQVITDPSVRSFKHLDRSRCGQDELNRLLSVKKSVKFQFQSSSVINNRMEIIFFFKFFQIFEFSNWKFSSVFDNRPSWSKMTIFDLFDISNYFLPKPTHIWNISLNFQKLVMVFIYYIFNNKILIEKVKTVMQWYFPV